MPQDDKNRDRQRDGQNRDDWQGQEENQEQESRSSGYADSPSDQIGSGRQSRGTAPELDDVDETDDDDREDDDREDGSPNRRRNIG
jgi:hypothetical protein